MNILRSHRKLYIMLLGGSSVCFHTARRLNLSEWEKCLDIKRLEVGRQAITSSLYSLSFEAFSQKNIISF